jgi:hypothetical protein
MQLLPQSTAAGGRAVVPARPSASRFAAGSAERDALVSSGSPPQHLAHHAGDARAGLVAADVNRPGRPHPDGRHPVGARFNLALANVDLAGLDDDGNGHRAAAAGDGPGHAERAGPDDAERAGPDDAERAGSDDAERAGPDDAERAGSDDAERAGSVDTDDAEHAGPDDTTHALADDAEHAGPDDAEHAGSHDAERPGPEDAEHAGSHDADRAVRGGRSDGAGHSEHSGYGAAGDCRSNPADHHDGGDDLGGCAGRQGC